MRLRTMIALIVVALIAAASYYLVQRLQRRAPAMIGQKIEDIRRVVGARLTNELAASGLALGRPMLIRVFKEERALEVWIQAGANYKLFKTYPICTFSGDLGPKLREGDRQAPEGVYDVTLRQLNPRSAYHLSFDLGFPNKFDEFYGRTGSFLMIHGSCVSIGCYAMTDAGIEEIYVLVEAALKSGQASVPVHAFPFHMTAQRRSRIDASQFSTFWTDLAHVYDAFEATRVPPRVEHRAGRYVVAQP